MKTRKSLPGLLLVSIVALGLSSCNKSATEPEFETALKSATFGTTVSAPAIVPEEEAGILQMREEEKMAHDVYVVFSGLFNQPVFVNIAKSETNHYDAVGKLITTYGLVDPSTGVAGTFISPEIAELYAKLIVDGSGSLEKALATGALIEETDILDLEELIAATTNPLILQVYNNLLSGSRNHLRSFVSTLATYGETYVPQLMEQEDFDAIINSAMETQKQNGTMSGSGSKNGKGKANTSSNGNANKGAKGKNGTGTGVCTNS